MPFRHVGNSVAVRSRVQRTPASEALPEGQTLVERIFRRFVHRAAVTLRRAAPSAIAAMRLLVARQPPRLPPMAYLDSCHVQSSGQQPGGHALCHPAVLDASTHVVGVGADLDTPTNARTARRRIPSSIALVAAASGAAGTGAGDCGHTGAAVQPHGTDGSTRSDIGMGVGAWRVVLTGFHLQTVGGRPTVGAGTAEVGGVSLLPPSHPHPQPPAALPAHGSVLVHAPAAPPPRAHPSPASALQPTHTSVLRTVHDTVYAVLGVRLADDQPLAEAGLDSVGAVELGASVGSALGVELPATVVFDHPTPLALTDCILCELHDQADAVHPVSTVDGSGGDGMKDEQAVLCSASMGEEIGRYGARKHGARVCDIPSRSAHATHPPSPHPVQSEGAW